MRNRNIRVLRIDRLQIEFGDVSFHEVGEEEVRKQGKFPRVPFFLIEDEVNDFAQIRISLFVIALELVFELGDSARNHLEKEGNRD